MTPQTIVLCGPMNGPASAFTIKNRRIFCEAAETLRSFGHTVINPAENAPRGITDVDLFERNHETICRIDATVKRPRPILALLPGWRGSDGFTMGLYGAAKRRDWIIATYDDLVSRWGGGG